MKKLIANKKLIICACAAVAVIVAAVIALLANKEETFRSIMVYDVEGNAVIARENVGEMNAAENLYLESGDRVSVAAASRMRMKLDDDKYVMAEENTIFSVQAEGTDADSRTMIALEQGAITNEIQNPLSEGSRFETSTPNSVMAVRGTVYRVELYADENGGQNTKLCCFQGKVGAKPVLPDGTYGEEILVPAGSELIVYQDGTTSDIQDIAYEELPLQAVANLLDMMENGQELTGVSQETLAQLSSETEKVSETSESEAKQPQQNEPAQEEATEEESDETVGQTDAQIHTKRETAKNTPAKRSGEKQNVPTPEPSAGQPVPKPQAPVIKPTKPADNGSIDNGNTEGEGSQNENENASDEEKSDDDKKDKKKPSKPKTYTVTFEYQGQVFATQRVKQGEKAAAPVLVPATSGTWDFDFETKIQANTTITWKAQ